MYEKVCDFSELAEGQYEIVVAKRALVLIIWPKGGEPRAFQAICPHAKEPLADAWFDGARIECRHHGWIFDATNGKCIKGKPCRLTEYPLRIEGGAVLIDADGIVPVYIGSLPATAAI
ncbi:MAG: (2Fe-2S)-binding protein [Beijerinckiaceae bacterium]|nr:MAG: (2Fe-2S)-binding protein [Beijerinckiaceae bacterium]